MKIIAYIAAAILIFFGVLIVWGAGGDQGGGWTWVCGGGLSVLFGLGLIWFASRKTSASGDTTNVTLKVDLPAQTKIESMACKNCGGMLKADKHQNAGGRPDRGMSVLWDHLSINRRTKMVKTSIRCQVPGIR